MTSKLDTMPVAGTLRERLSSPWVIFLVGLLVRLIYITVARSYRFHPALDHFEFGWEAGRVGRSLALGRGFADPFVPSGTGPTAWLPPLYPMIIGAVFRVFGIYTWLSGWVLLAINSVFGAATAPAVYEIAERCFGAGGNWQRGRRIALWSAWIWALYPATMQYSVRWIWETSLTTLLIAWVLVVTLRLRGTGSGDQQVVGNGWALWLSFGLLWGLIGLSNATPLLMLPVCVIWVIAGVRDRRSAFAGAALSSVVFVACLAPWTWRNWQVFHRFIPIRGNFGAELWAGNGPSSIGMPWGITVFSESDLKLYAALGEPKFVKERHDLATSYIERLPLRFFKLCVKRFYLFWVGVPHPLGGSPFLEYVREITYGLLSITGLLGVVLAIRKRISGAELLAATLVFIPLAYYAVTVGARFRHPLEPIMVILTVYLLDSARSAKS